MDTGNESRKLTVHAATGKPNYYKTPNQYVTVHGIKLAHQTIGYRTDALALVLSQNFTGTMDDWDQALIEELAANRSVVIFESAGIGAILIPAMGHSFSTPSSSSHRRLPSLMELTELHVEQMAVLAHKGVRTAAVRKVTGSSVHRVKKGRHAA